MSEKIMKALRRTVSVDFLLLDLLVLSVLGLCFLEVYTAFM